MEQRANKKRGWIRRAARAFAAACTAALCFFLFLPVAHADEVKVTITATPTELADTGTVTFTFEIANYNQDYPLNDLAITYLGTTYDVSNGQAVPPSGSLRDIVLNLNVSATQLGNPIVFTVTWTRNGEPMSQEATYTVQRAENPVINVTRTVDKAYAKPGETITVTYLLKNDTKFDMTGITLIDENVSDNAILELPSLKASSSYSTNFSYVMGDASVVSTPFATYTVNGKTKTFTSVDPLTLTMLLIQLDMRVEAGTPTISGVNFNITLENTGSQAISNIQVTDERANAVNEAPFSLEPGESNTLSYLVVPLMTETLRNVQFKLTGVDPFGETYTLAPETKYEVYPYIDESQISVTMAAQTITQWSAASKSLSARIIITNHSTVELTNVTVLETTLGVLQTYDLLPAGETTFDLDVPLGSPRNLSFSVKADDPTGTNRVLASCLMPVAYGTETPEPETATPEPDTRELALFDSIGSGITKVLAVLGALMILSVAVLVVLTVLERSRTPYRRPEEDDDWADDFDEPEARKPRANAYRAGPDPEEVSYTKRMLAVRDEGQAGVVNNGAQPLPLPPAQARPEPTRIISEAPREPARTAASAQKPARADETAERLIHTARTRYPDGEAAAYRPIAAPVPKPAPSNASVSNPAPKPAPQRAAGAPRVFDTRRQPSVRPIEKRTVIRVEKDPHGGSYEDDE